MNAIQVSYESLEVIYHSINNSCNVMNDKLDTHEIQLPFYDFTSFVEYIEECQNNSIIDIKFILASDRHRIACYFKALSNNKISLEYTTLNTTRSDYVKSFSSIIDVAAGSVYVLSILTSDTDSVERRTKYTPSDAQNVLIEDAELIYNNSALVGTVSETVERIKKHRYFDENNKNVATHGSFLQFLVNTYHLKGIQNTLVVPMYAGYTDLAVGNELKNTHDIYNTLSITANEIEPDKITKSTLPKHFNGVCLGAVSGSNILVVGEGFLNTAIVHHALNVSGINVTSIALNGVSGFANLLLALKKCGVENSVYKKIVIVPDNDATGEPTDGLVVARDAYKKLLKLGYAVAITDNYINSSAATTGNIKCDIFDAYQSLGENVFITKIVKSLDFCDSLAEHNIKEQQRGYTKKHITMIDKLIKSNKGKFINWSTNESVLKLIGPKKFDNIKSVHRALCINLSIPYMTHKGIFSLAEVALDFVQYRDGKPFIDAKKEMFLGGTKKTPILVKSPMGSGKTDSVIRPFLEQTSKEALVVLPNIALTKQTVAHFDDMKVKHYKSSTGDIKGRVVTTIDSLNKFNTAGVSRPIIMDEMQQIISLFCEGARLPNKFQLIEQIKMSIDNGNSFVGTSADIDDSSVEFVSKVFNVVPKVVIFGIQTNNNPNESIPVNFYKKMADFRAKMLEITDDHKKVLFVTDSLRQAEIAKAFFELRHYSCKVISSKTKDHTIYEPNKIDKDYDVIIITPSASVGVSFTLNERVVFVHYNGVIDTLSMVQLMSRSRKRESLHVYEVGTIDVERLNKLKIQASNVDYASNKERLTGIMYNLLVARKAYKSLNTITIIEALINQGYKPEYVDSNDVHSEYKLSVKDINKKIVVQTEVNKQLEVDRYVELTKDLTEQQITDIVADKGTERANDEKKVAATLKKYDALNRDGLDALNDKWFSRLHIVSMGIDEENILSQTLSVKQNNTKASLCTTDFVEISRIVREVKRYYDAGRYELSDYFPILKAHFESVDIFAAFHSKVLNQLDINVGFLHSSLNYEESKTNGISKITVAFLRYLGYDVKKKRVLAMYASIRDNAIQVAFDESVGRLNMDEMFDAIGNNIPDSVYEENIINNSEVTF